MVAVTVKVAKMFTDVCGFFFGKILNASSGKMSVNSSISGSIFSPFYHIQLSNVAILQIVDCFSTFSF